MFHASHELCGFYSGLIKQSSVILAGKWVKSRQEQWDILALEMIDIYLFRTLNPLPAQQSSN